MIWPIYPASGHEAGLDAGLPEEDLRYLKPQATEFKAIIGMNAHAPAGLVRYPLLPQRPARDPPSGLADAAALPQGRADLFVGAGPSCVQLGYCPENRLQNPRCQGRILTRDAALELLRARAAERNAPFATRPERV